jgi:hypothetical protein
MAFNHQEYGSNLMAFDNQKKYPMGFAHQKSKGFHGV